MVLRGGAVAGGSWQQSFGPQGSAAFSATHTLTGSWGSWDLQILSPNLNVIGAGHFTLQAVEALKAPSCAPGLMDSVSMVGVVVFQDP